MKVKNVMFAGFAAAILSGVCGAASAAEYNLVTEGYVTSKLAGKEDKGTSYTKAEADDLLATKVSTETYAQYIEDQANVDAEQTRKINVNTEAIKTLSGGEGGAGVASLMQDVSDLKAAVNNADGAVATKIAAAVADKADKDTVTELAGTVTTLSQTVETKADTTTVNALSDKVTALEGAGYQTAGDVNTLIGQAEIAQSQVAGLETALAGKQDKIENLDTIVANAAKGATAVQPDALTQTLGSYVTSEALENAGYQTETDVKGTVEGYGYQTADDVNTLIGQAEIAQSQVAGLETALAGKQDKLIEAQLLAVNSGIDATKVAQIQTNADNIALKADASEVETALDGKLNVMENAGTYLVKRDGEGNISYVSVEIVGATQTQE